MISASAFIGANQEYTFTNHKFISKKLAYLFFIRTKEIQLQNIVKTAYHNKGLFNKLLNSGTIILETNELENFIIEIEFIDNVKDRIDKINYLILNAKNKRGIKMGLFNKLMFWKKDDLAMLDDPGFGSGFGKNPGMDMGGYGGMNTE
jgi:hypothetical protein